MIDHLIKFVAVFFTVLFCLSFLASVDMHQENILHSQKKAVEFVDNGLSTISRNLDLVGLKCAEFLKCCFRLYPKTMGRRLWIF